MRETSEAKQMEQEQKESKEEVRQGFDLGIDLIMPDFKLGFDFGDEE